MKKAIYPCLWFDGNAKEAAEFYCSVFPDRSIVSVNPMVAMLESFGQRLMLLNGGPQYTINSSISFFEVFETSEEVKKVWVKLIDGGTVLMALDAYPWSPVYGWVQDKFGVNWQLFLGKNEGAESRFSPSLLFTGSQNGKAQEAMRFYSSLFQESSIDVLSTYEKNDPDKEGNLKYGQFHLGKKKFRAMDSSRAHAFSFNEAVSFVVECESQEEIDYFWEEFTREGEEGRCGWLKDKFGVSWQIIPEELSRLMSDPEKSQRVINAFLQMKKFDIQALRNA